MATKLAYFVIAVLGLYLSTMLLTIQATTQPMERVKQQVSAPSLSEATKRTCDNLRRGAISQVTDYEQRFSVLKDSCDAFLVNLIKLGFNAVEAWKTAKEFFGDDSVRFAGVDGTMYSRPMFDLVIFFGGAYASTGTITFQEAGNPKVDYDVKTIQQNIGVSSVVPIYVNEIPDVDLSFAAREQPAEVDPSKLASEQEIANNSLIANAIMTFSEFYLAYKLAVDQQQDFRILLMDRSLSTERASLLYETGKTGFWEAKSALIGYVTGGRHVDKNDLALARQHVYNKDLGLPAPRADYLRYAIISLIQEKGTAKEAQVCQAFGAEDEKRRKRVNKALDRLVRNEVLTFNGDVYCLSPRYVDSWERMKQVTIELGDKIFLCGGKLDVASTSCTKILKDGKEHWLTTLDIELLTLYALQMLMEECWRRRILLVGITKDTSARDFNRQLIQIMQNEGLLDVAVDHEALAALPNTDRMILQSASIFNSQKIVPPWGLVEYDSVFRTMKADLNRGKGYVSGLIRNKVGLEKAFLKTYVQLSQAKSDPLLRSNVLLIDRLAYALFDYKPECRLALLDEMSDGTQEHIEVLLYRDKTVPNRIQNLVMSMLVAMAPSNIPEAFGHNKPLFVADKIAKWNYGQFKCIADSTANWMMNNPKLRKFIFYMSTFRERRASVEQARRENR
ncbi:MAG TPA: hypothetical protein VK536_10360 [Candidatus Limnocylindrales bacterium]|nr:hypothetical protein [Candidatus Limnocylindrales bacterium]